jgi:hypothetical protein
MGKGKKLMHTTSLEMSKRLKEAGWVKETLFIWVEWPNGTWRVARNYDFQRKYAKDWLPAPILTEILEELPEINLIRRRCPNNYITAIRASNLVPWTWSEGLNPCDAAAEVWMKVKGGSQ